MAKREAVIVLLNFDDPQYGHKRFNFVPLGRDDQIKASNAAREWNRRHLTKLFSILSILSILF